MAILKTLSKKLKEMKKVEVLRSKCTLCSVQCTLLPNSDMANSLKSTKELHPLQ